MNIKEPRVTHLKMKLGAIALSAGLTMPGFVLAADICEGFGPQAPRDITSEAGSNARVFTLAPAPSRMNLCNIHTHTNAEHKGPGFAISAGNGENAGFRCNDSNLLTPEELTQPLGGHEAFHGIKPGDTIEVHWVYSSCDVTPGEGLGACLSEKCINPQLRVEAQVFLVVNDPKALDFAEFSYDGHMENGLHQAKSLPTGSGSPVVYRGSTTGPKYTEALCSPLQVTWNVRPQCIKIDIDSLYKWAKNGNIFKETHSHGVRQLVTSQELLSPID
jgi:hypothetical protein